MDLFAAWKGIREQLFDPRTNLFYDYTTSHDRAQKFRYLPAPEEVAADFPNPCGWGTGMEDCMLNAGSALDILCKLIPDPLFSARVVQGIALCCEGHHRPGFVARGMTPTDEPRCYSNTSRDQLTLAVYGLWRVLHSGGDLSPALREKLIHLLELIAGDCRRSITPEHQYNLFRLDGKPALVSTLWNCAPHEIQRLPMIYLAAFEATGRRCYLDWALEYLPRAVEPCWSSQEEASWWHLPIVQMQLSLLLMIECGCVPQYERALRGGMDRLAEFAEPRFLEALREAELFDGDWYAPNRNFRRLPMVLHHASLSADQCNGLFEGKPYLVPLFPEEFGRPQTLLQKLGSYLTILLASGSRKIPGEWLSRLDRVVSSIDFSRHCSDGGIKLLHALAFLPMERQLQITGRASICSDGR